MKLLQFKAPHGRLDHHRFGTLTNANITPEIKAELVKENEAYKEYFEEVEAPTPKKKEEKVKPVKPQSDESKA